jgi:hypothetical protein
MKAFASLACVLLSITLTAACGSGSSFSGGGAKEKPAKKSVDAKKDDKARPAKPKEKEPEEQETTPFTEENPEAEEDLGEETVVPENPPEDVKLPENTIVKGSFRVWTVPADPEPLMAYDIYIDIKLPSNASDYSKDDLSGAVVGTDGYQQPIGRDALSMGIKSQRFESFQGRATLIISVPGALNLVKDTIDIRSDLLNESQNIEIVF